MSYRLAEYKHAHPEPIDPIKGCDEGAWDAFTYRYHVTFTSIIASLAAMATEVQETLYGPHAGTAGSFFLVAREPAPNLLSRGTWLWHMVIERPDCETDYHVCSAGEWFGHDGSDEAAIYQLQGELDEAMTEDALLSDVKVIARAAIPRGQPKIGWQEATREALLERV